MSVEDMYLERRAIGTKLGKEAEQRYRLQRQKKLPRFKWIVIENGKYFRLHSIRSMKQVWDNHGLATFTEVVEYACLFCFTMHEPAPTSANVHLFTDMASIPAMYSGGLTDSTHLITRAHDAYKPKHEQLADLASP